MYWYGGISEGHESDLDHSIDYHYDDYEILTLSAWLEAVLDAHHCRMFLPHQMWLVPNARVVTRENGHLLEVSKPFPLEMVQLLHPPFVFEDRR